MVLLLIATDRFAAAGVDVADTIADTAEARVIVLIDVEIALITR